MAAGESLNSLISDHLQFISFGQGLLIYFLYQQILLPRFLVPASYFLVDKVPGQIKDKSLREQLEVKFPLGVFKTFAGVLELYVWVSYFVFEFPIWQDWQNWPHYGKWQLTDNPEYDVVHIPYFTYLGFCWFIFWIDILKKDRKGDWMGYMFDLHHILAIFLTTRSRENGFWRFGFLTRITHVIVDIAMYTIKSAEFLYKQRTGVTNDAFLKAMILVTWLIWTFLKVIVYGWIALSTILMSRAETRPETSINMMWALTIGSVLMWVLQLIWSIGILQIVVTYFGGSKGTADWLHGDKAPPPRTKDIADNKKSPSPMYASKPNSRKTTSGLRSRKRQLAT